MTAILMLLLYLSPVAVGILVSLTMQPHNHKDSWK